MKNKIVVVYSSHFPEDKNNKFNNHISKNIGVKHLVVCYPNYNQYSLTEIYNRAIDEHNDENTIMVFCHNDIQIHTKNWGRLLLTKFNSTDYQIIGVAGTPSLADNGIWWNYKSQMVGIVDHTNGITNWTSKYSEPKRGKITPVVLVDGLFLAVDCNEIAHRWDEDFKGFHLYDLSFCVPNYLDGCNIGVTTDIRVLHESIGLTNEQWDKSRLQFVEKYKDELPLVIHPYHKYLNPKLTKKPKVTVIIPTKDNLTLIKNNIRSWKDIVKYDNYEIIIADTGSPEEVIKEYDEFLCENIKLIRYDYYNFAKINNNVVNNHVSDDTDLILFCNDDILLLNDALSRMVEIYNQTDNVGTIGIRLHYGDSSIQHNGMLIFRGVNNQLILSHVDIKKTENYATGVNYNSKGNTGGFMLIEKRLFNAYGGFSENYIECFEDVELNLKCRHQGLRNITVSDAVAYHYESISRNKLPTAVDNQRIDFTKLLTFINDNNIQL